MMAYRNAKLIVLFRRWLWEAWPMLGIVACLIFAAYSVGFVRGAMYVAEAANENFVCQPR